MEKQFPKGSEGAIKGNITRKVQSIMDDLEEMEQEIPILEVDVSLPERGSINEIKSILYYGYSHLVKSVTGYTFHTHNEVLFFSTCMPICFKLSALY